MIETLKIYIFFILNLIVPLIIYYFTINYFNKSIAVAKVNNRSLHKVEVISGGGLIFSTQIIFILFFFLNNMFNDINLILSLVAILILGYLDDKYELKSFLKFICLILISSYVVLQTINLDTLSIEINNINLNVYKYSTLKIIIEIITLFWIINLYNFMDGSDGLLSVNSIFIFSTLLFFIFNSPQVDYLLVILICIIIISLFSFLLFNLPNAKIFMGDSGSLFVGLLTYVICVYMINKNLLDIWVFFILNSVFFIDSTITVLKRLYERKNIFMAHNEHFYQGYIRQKNYKFNKKYNYLESRKKAHFSFLKKYIFIFLLIILPTIYIIELGIISSFFGFTICYSIVFLITINQKITF